MRDYARALARGLKPGLIVTASGRRVDPLDAEKYIEELEDPVVEGGIYVHAYSPAKLLELGATRLTARPGQPYLYACFRKARVEKLLANGCVPLVWMGLKGEKCQNPEKP